MKLVHGLAVTAVRDVVHVHDPSSGASRTVQVGQEGEATWSLVAARGAHVVLHARGAEPLLVVCDVLSAAVVARAGRVAGALSFEGDPAARSALPSAVPSWDDAGPQLLEIDPGGELRTHDLPQLAAAERGFSVHAAPAARRVLVVDHEGPVLLYDLDTRAVLEGLPVLTSSMARPQVLADGSCWLVDSALPGHLVHVDADGTVLRRWPARAPLALSVEPEERWGAVTLRDRIDVLDLSTGDTLRSLVPPQPPGIDRGPLLLADGRMVFWSLPHGFQVVP